MTACSQTGCTVAAQLSLVWPGHGRIAYCAAHYLKAIGIATALGLTPDALDVKIIEDPDRASGTANRS